MMLALHRQGCGTDGFERSSVDSWLFRYIPLPCDHQLAEGPGSGAVTKKIVQTLFGKSLGDCCKTRRTNEEPAAWIKQRHQSKNVM